MRLLADLLACLRFFSRLPLLSAAGGETLAAAVAMVPIAGLVIGLIPAVVLTVGIAIGLPPLLAAALAIASLVITTGALHEDGLADCADGFGGGRTVARKLEIMRDSRIGTYGTCALILSLLGRTAAISAVAGTAPRLASVAILLAAILSRTACLLPLLVLPPARRDGLGSFAGRPSIKSYAIACGLSFVLSFLAPPLGVGLAPLSLAIVGTGLAAAAVCGLARRQIHGHTGDVCGATQQAVEITVLAVLSIR